MIARLAGLLPLLLASSVAAQTPAEDPLPPGAVARFGTLRYRYPAEFGGHGSSALAFSPDGKTVVTACGPAIALWNVATGQIVRRLDSPATHIGFLCFAPDGKQLAWSGSVHAQAGFGGGVHCGVINLADGKSLWTTPAGRILPFSPDGKHLLAWVWAGKVKLLDGATGKDIRVFSPKQADWGCAAAALSRDGKTVAALFARVNEEGRIADDAPSFELRIWDADTGKLRAAFDDGAQRTHHLVLSDDGTVVFQVHQRFARTRDVASGAELHRVTVGEKEFPQGFIQAEDGKSLAVSVMCFVADEQSRGFRMSVRQEKYATNTTVHVISSCLAFSPDGKTRATVDAGFAFVLTDVVTGKLWPVFDCPRRAIWCLRFLPDGKTLLSMDGSDLYWWDLATRKLSAKDISPERALPQKLTSPDGKLSAAFLYGQHGQYPSGLFLFDAAGKELRRLQAPDYEFQHLAFSADGRRLLALYPVRVWDTDTGKLLREWRFGVTCAALSPDGLTVAIACRDHPKGFGGGPGSASAGDFALWDVATGKKLRTLAPSARPVSAVAFSPDGRTLATTSVDGTVFVWEVATAGERLRLSGHQGPVRVLVFAPHGKTLATGGDDCTILLWDLYPAPGGPRAVKDLWADLLGGEAAAAHRAMGGLVAMPDKALVLIQAHWKQVPVVDAGRIQMAIADLDDQRFAVRDQAMRDLEFWQGQVEPALRKALANKPPLEQKLRIELVLAKLDRAEEAARWNPPAKEVQALRVLELLEHLGTPAAREYLKQVAAGAPGSRWTQAAKAALERQ